MNRAIMQHYQRFFQAPMLRNRLFAISGGVAAFGCAALLSTIVVRKTFLGRVTFAHPVTTTASSSDPKPSGIKEIKPSQELLSKLNTYRVVDVREPNERVETGFVPTSINIPLGKVLEGDVTVPDDKPLLMVCRSGARSKRAGDALVGRGYRDVTNLSGGTLGWISAGLPVERVQSQEIKELFPSTELQGKLPSYTVIDVREPHERVETGYVPDSINIPLAGVLDGSAAIPSEKKPYLMVCRSGARSMKASEALASRGYDVTNLATGTLGWIKAGLLVEKD